MCRGCARMNIDARGWQSLKLEPLHAHSFAAFGEVVESGAGMQYLTNGGTALRAHAISPIDCDAKGGCAFISMYHYAQAVPLDPVRMMERHPLSSQAFIPLGRMRLLLIVAEASADPEPGTLRAFLSDGHQGVNYRRGTWHHPLIALDPGSLIVIDRSESAVTLVQDYEEHWLLHPVAIETPTFAD